MSNRRLLGLILAVLGLGAVVLAGAVMLVTTHARQVLPKLAAVSAPTQISIPAASAFPGQPLPCGEKAYTEHQYRQLRLSYYRKRGILAYQQFGKPNPAWDGLVRDFLERNACTQADVKPPPDPQEMLGLARRIVATGCNDPVALTQAGLRLIVAEDYAGGEACLQQALEAFGQGKYPVYCRVGAAIGMAQRNDVWGKRVQRTPPTAADLIWRDKAIATVAAAAQAKFFAPGEERVFWNNVLVRALEEGLPDARSAMVKALQDRPGTNPWLLQMAMGTQALKDAWDVRGNAWASQVKSEAWPVFERGLEVARGHWEHAYNLHPGYPEAATNLITVAKAAGSPNPRVWFDRAVAGQFDFRPAYDLMIDALLPRWGGSHGEMLRFAHECLDTRRFDTCVPMIYGEIVRTIADRDNQPAIWQDAEVWKDLGTAYEGTATYLAAHNPDRVKPVRTDYAVLAWRTGHLDTARQQLEAMGGSVDRAFFTAGVAERPEVLMASIYAASDQEREAIKKAEQSFQSRQNDKGRAEFARLLKHEREPHVQAYLRDRLQVLQWEEQFAKGQWVDLLPTQDLAGWEMARGSMTVLPDGRGFQITPDDRFALLVNHIRPSIHYELACDVEFPAEPVPGIKAGFAAEMAMAPGPRYDGCSIRREPAAGLSGLAAEPPRTWPLREVPQKLQMQLLKEGDYYTLKMNGQTVFANQRMGDLGTPGSATVGLGGEGWAERSKPVIYRNVRIRRT